MKHSHKSERQHFLDALAIWDRPEEQLYGKVFEREVDTDAFVDRALSMPRAGIVLD